MTNEEAIEILASAPRWDRESKDAIRMAIEALKAQQKAQQTLEDTTLVNDKSSNSQGLAKDVPDTNVGDMISRQDAIDTTWPVVITVATAGRRWGRRRGGIT